MNRKRTVAIYVFFDVLAACLAWTLFFLHREMLLSGHSTPENSWLSPFFFQTLVCLPTLWCLAYYITGYYSNIYRKSRLIELTQTFFISLIGIATLFFSLILDDFIHPQENYANLFFSLLCLHFGLTYFFRVIHTSVYVHKIHKRQLGFNTLVIGGSTKAVELYHILSTQRNPSGNRLVGFVTIEGEANPELESYLPCLGTTANIPEIIENGQIEEIIITTDTSEHKLLSKILIMLQRFNVIVWGIPDLYDILAGNPKNDNLYGLPLFKISNGIMPVWAANVKRILDVVFSLIAIILFLPISFAIIVAITLDSRGPFLYSQIRVGRYGRPFRIFKFRTMIANAEQQGPELSSENDPRITGIGRFLRKTHLDEIPQFINVILGHMSIVGPRPERKYFIDQLIEKAPQYNLLQKVRPGITSWGQIKYGYASNLKEMLERLPYDLVYLKNASLYLDLKIMIYSILELFHAKGR